MEKIERPEQTEQNALRGFYTFGSIEKYDPTVQT